MNMQEINELKNQYEKLKGLADFIAQKIDQTKDVRTIASLLKQYRETLAEIEETKNNFPVNDEIADILIQRKIEGKPGAIRYRGNADK